MSDLIVIGHASREQAERTRPVLLRLAREIGLEVADALVATAGPTGAIRCNQMADLWAIGPAGGGLWGLLAGLFFLDPRRGAAIGAGADPCAGALSAYGIGDAFLQAVAALLPPGGTVVLLLVPGGISDRLMQRLTAQGGMVLRACLDPAAEQDLRLVLARPPAVATGAAAMAAG